MVPLDSETALTYTRVSRTIYNVGKLGSISKQSEDTSNFFVVALAI